MVFFDHFYYIRLNILLYMPAYATTIGLFFPESVHLLFY